MSSICADMWRTDQPRWQLERQAFSERRDPLSLMFDRIETTEPSYDVCWTWTGHTIGAEDRPTLILRREGNKIWWLNVRRYLLTQYQATEFDWNVRIHMNCGNKSCVNPAHMRPTHPLVRVTVQFPEIEDRHSLLEWYLAGNRTRVKVTLDEYYELQRRIYSS